MKKLRSVVGSYIVVAMSKCTNDIIKLFLQLEYSLCKHEEINSSYISHDYYAKVRGVMYKCSFCWTPANTSYTVGLPPGSSVEVYKPILKICLFSVKTRNINYKVCQSIGTLTVTPKEYEKLIGCYRKEKIEIPSERLKEIRKIEILENVMRSSEATEDEKFVAEVAKDCLLFEKGDTFVYRAHDIVSTQVIAKTRDVISVDVYKNNTEEKVRGCSLSYIASTKFFVDFYHRQFGTASSTKHTIEINISDLQPTYIYVKGGHSDKPYTRKLIFTDANLK